MSSFEDRVRKFLKHSDELEATTGEEAGEDGYNKEFLELKAISQKYKDNDTFPADSGKLACNKKKNRFKDILPYEHTRVALHREEGVEGSDYINANYITDANGDVMYIASQGPLPHTVNDFWRMLWYHNIEVVVMACREVEMGKQKCECYWGEPGQKKMFGPIEVTTVKETNMSNDFVIRDLMAECQGETQNIRQYHYTAWPDHLKPTSIYPILRMIQMLQDARKQPSVPIAVHCSAGCGRTGTIITIDIIRTVLKTKEMSDEFSVFEIVKKLRTMRPAMVQARDQYHFVYQAVSILAKNFLEGNTTLQKPPLPAAKPGSRPPEGKEPKHDYENWASIDSTRDKVQAEQGKPSPPPPTAKPGTKPTEPTEPKHDYENWANIDSVREKIQQAESKLTSKSVGSSLEEPPKPMPRKKSVRAQMAKIGEGPPASTTKGSAPGTPPKPPKSGESSPAMSKKLSGSPPKVAKKPTESPKAAKKPMTPPKSGAPLMPKKPSITELLMQECGDILDKKEDDKPSVDLPSTISEDTDAPPPVPCQTEDSLKLVQESSYDVPGFTYDIPKSPTETAFPSQQLASSLLPPVGETPPPIPTTKPPQRSSSPQPVHTPSSGFSGPSLGTGGGSAKVKGLKNLFNSKKGDERKKKAATLDISGPAGLLHTGGSGGAPGATFSVSPSSHQSSPSPEPDGAEYATPILDPPRHTPVNSKYHFSGENGFGKRIARPHGPRKEPLHWNSGQFRRPAARVDQIA